MVRAGAVSLAREGRAVRKVELESTTSLASDKDIRVNRTFLGGRQVFGPN
jgi:hypothetical protein